MRQVVSTTGLTLLLLLGAAAQAMEPLPGWQTASEAIGLSQSLRFGYWRSTRSVDDQINLLPASLWLRERYSFDSGMTLHAEGWLQSKDVAHPWQAESRGELREAYLRDTLGDFDIRFGRQIVAWGRADRINPTDNLSARDLTRMFVEDDDLKRGSTLLRLAHPLGETAELQLYWIPEFRPEVHPLAERIGPFSIAGDDRRPTDNSQHAIKVDGSRDGLDWSLSWFNGHNPSGDLRALDAARPLILVREYARQQTFGADAATVVGNFNLRADAAYTDFPDRDAGDLSKRPFLFAVFGGDRNLGEQFNLNLQYLLRRVSDFEPLERLANPIERGIATINAVEAGQRDRYQRGATLRLAWSSSDQRWRAELFALQDFGQHDGIVRTLIRHDLSDDLRLSLGHEWNHGESDTLFGSLHDNNGLFMELRLGY